MKIWLLRHGPTAFNKKGIFMGSRDEPMDVIEETKLREIRTYFNSNEVERIYSSPLRRCRQTSSKCFPEMDAEFDSRLVERSLGDWEGRVKSDLQRDYPKAFTKTGRLNPSFQPPKAESTQELAERVILFFEEHFFSDNEPSIIVSHNGTLCIARAILDHASLAHAYETDIPHLQPQSFDVSNEHITLGVDLLRLSIKNKYNETRASE